MLTYLIPWKALILQVILVVLLASKINANTEDDFQITYERWPTKIEFFVGNKDFVLQNVTCKSPKGSYNGSANNVCENLEPCTVYMATLTIVKNDEDAQGVPDAFLEVNTTYARPHVELIGVEPDQFTMLIKWKATNRTCISKFEINVKSEEKEIKNVIQNDEDSILVVDLSPCQSYDIQLKTTDVESEIIDEPIETNSTTFYAEPENVTNVKFETSDEGVIRVTWDSPKNKTCVSKLYLKWATMACIEEMDFKNKGISPKDENIVDETGGSDGDGACEWNVKILTDPNKKDYIIRNLEGCDEYGIVFYINDNSTAKSDLTYFNSPEQIPSEILDEKYEVNSTAIEFNWSPPKLNSKCVEAFFVEVVGPLQRSEELQDTYNETTNKTFVHFANLYPCGDYNISIQAVSHNGTGGVAVSFTISTSEDSPTKIRNIRVEPKPKELILQWDPPDFAVLCLLGYRIAGWYDSSTTSVFDKTTNETNIIVNDLISCQVYTVQIIPFTKSKDGALERIEQITSPMVATAPKPFQRVAQHSHSFELSARVNDEDYHTNNCQILFARFECETKQNVPFKKSIQYVEGRVGDLSFKATMSPLSPNMEYTCTAKLYNTAGWSENSSGAFNTAQYYPEEPMNVSVKSLTTTSIRFQWEVPKYANGNINVYRLYFRLVQAAYYIPPYCERQTVEPTNSETSKLETEFASLQPYSYYSVQVAAQNDYGTGDFTLPSIERTLPSISEAVENFKVISVNGPDVSSSTFKAFVVFSWQMPCKSNGEIQNFELEYVGTRPGYTPVSFFRRVEPKYDANGLMTFNETDLKPEYNYEVSISVINKDVVSQSRFKIVTFQSPAGIPEKIKDVSTAKVDAFEASNPTTSAVVRFPVDLLNSDSGTILYAALLLSQKNCNAEPELLVGALDSNNDWPNSSYWMESYKGEDCISQYQTTPIRWQPVQPKSSTDGLSSRSGNFVEYTIGADTCTNDTKRYCNGPLRADTEYQMVIRLFTKSSYSDAAVLEFKTDSLIKLTLILVAIISCLMVAFVAGCLYLYITKKIVWHRESGHGIEDSSGDVTSKNFALFYSELSKRDKLQREFKELTVIATDLTFSASEANEYKNRYRDIFPYDKNRVILDVDADGNDYINASFINGYRRKKEYIATQGPKQESTVDFWRMVLQHNVRIIVMVTQFKEENIIKCHHYYPWEWNDIKVEILKEDFFDLYDRREMVVTHSKQNIHRKIVHFYFKKWPDHGVPTDPMSLITFVRKVKAEKCPSNSPIVVHCSAGVGRTGTFIGLDIIMQRLKSESKINIFETVKELRFQRMKMVQSMQQYTFLYTCSYQLALHRHGKYNDNKKVSFKNDQDTALGTVHKLGVPDAESGSSFKTNHLESIM